MNSVGGWLCSDLQRTLGFIYHLFSGEKSLREQPICLTVRDGVQANAKKSMGSSQFAVWFWFVFFFFFSFTIIAAVPTLHFLINIMNYWLIGY